MLFLFGMPADALAARKKKTKSRRPSAAQMEKEERAEKAEKLNKFERGEKTEKSDKTEAPSTKPATPSSKADAKPGAAEMREMSSDETEGRSYTFRIHSYLGLLIARTTGLAFGVSAAIIPNPESSWYFGVETNYTNPPAGSVLQVLAGVWREFPVYGSSKLSLGLGALAGPVFPALTTGYPKVTYATFLTVGLCKEIDELAMIRAEFRPGLIDSRFAFLMNFGVVFRFL